MTTYTCSIETPLGTMTAAACDRALSGLWFVGQKHYPQETAHWQHCPDHAVFGALRLSLSRYFSGEIGLPEPELAPRGTPFQMAVWQALLAIPYGETVSYAEIARQIARARGISAMSAQAVGGAVGRNPITILIPCHRVLGSDGKLTGYAGGIDRKLALLRLEGVRLQSESCLL